MLVTIKDKGGDKFEREQGGVQGRVWWRKVKGKVM